MQQRVFMKPFILSCLLLFSLSIYAQCTGDCCNKEKITKTTNTANTSPMVEKVIKVKPIACKLTSPELQKRKEIVIASLKTKVLEKQELENGYKYKFTGTDELLDEVTAFIKSERSCCDFFDFTFTITEETLWLSITGPIGAKEFIKEEMGF